MFRQVPSRPALERLTKIGLAYVMGWGLIERRDAKNIDLIHERLAV